MLVGMLGAALESIVMSSKGLSLGWICMNGIVGFFCGLVLFKANEKETKKFVIKAVAVVLGNER